MGQKACLNLTRYDLLFLNMEENLNTANQRAVFFPKWRNFVTTRHISRNEKSEFGGGLFPPLNEEEKMPGIEWGQEI